MIDLCADVDAVVHMGGMARENTYDEVRDANIDGLYNLYEGARKHGVKRVVWASSNHAIGFYPRRQIIDAGVTPKPDSLYGVSKVFGEAIAELYFNKFGIESVSLRIGSCFPEPVDRRMLATWLSYRDLVQLVTCGLTAPAVGHTIVYGISDNRETFWDNSMAAHLGYRPQDSAEAFREKLEAATPEPDGTDPAVNFQGGSFARDGHFED